MRRLLLLSTLLLATIINSFGQYNSFTSVDSTQAIQKNRGVFWYNKRDKSWTIRFNDGTNIRTSKFWENPVKRINNVTPDGNGNLQLPISGLYTVNDARVATLPPSLSAITITDPGKEGLFVYDPTDTTTPDDGGATCVVVADRRYKYRPEGSINGKRFGMTGYNITSDSAALMSAIAYLKRSATITVAGQAAKQPKITLRLPAGIYRLPNVHILVDSKEFVIEGDGKENTILAYSGSGTLFDLGWKRDTVTNLFSSGLPNGDAQSFTLRNLSIKKFGFENWAAAGTRTGIAIRDNGNGSVNLDNVAIVGFKYGFQGRHGSDFDKFNFSDFVFNDVGIYLGPGSQQIGINFGQIAENVEGLVIDRAQQGTLFCVSFLDNTTQIGFEQFVGSTRLLTQTTFSGTSETISWKIISPWMESGQYNTTTPYWIRFQGNTPDIYRGVNIEQPHILAGSALVNNSAFLTFDQAAGLVKVTSPTYQGAGLHYKTKGNGQNVVIQDWYTANAYTEPASNSLSNGVTEIQTGSNLRRTIAGQAQNRDMAFTGSANMVRESVDENYNVRWSAKIGGNFLERFAWDVQNSRLYFGSGSTSTPSIDAGGTTPGGTYANGSFRMNTSGAGPLGWVRQGGAWSPFYSTSAVSQLTNDAGYLTGGSANSLYLPLLGGTVTGTANFQNTATSGLLATFGATPTQNGWTFQNSGGSNQAVVRSYAAGVMRSQLGSDNILLNPTGILTLGALASNGTSAKVQVTGGLSSDQVATTAVVGAGSTPTVTLGAAAGAGATYTITGTAIGGKITLTTGTGTATGTLLTLTLPAIGSLPVFPVVSCGGGTYLKIGTSGESTTGFSISAVEAPGASGTYVIYYHSIR